MTETDIILLLNYIMGAPPRYRHVPGHGDMEPFDEYQILVTGEQRNLLADALRSYYPKPQSEIRPPRQLGKVKA